MSATTKAAIETDVAERSGSNYRFGAQNSTIEIIKSDPKSIADSLKAEEESQVTKCPGRLFLWFSWISIGLLWIWLFILFIIMIQDWDTKIDGDWGDVWGTCLLTAIGSTACMCFVTRICFAEQMLHCLDGCGRGLNKICGDCLQKYILIMIFLAILGGVAGFCYVMYLEPVVVEEFEPTSFPTVVPTPSPTGN